MKLLDGLLLISMGRGWGSIDEWCESNWPRNTVSGFLLFTLGVLISSTVFISGLMYNRITEWRLGI